jgi:hypothetical protein
MTASQFRSLSRPLSAASTDLHAAIWFVAPHATRWMYATPERVGVIVNDRKGSRRLIDGDELNRAYALMDCAEADGERTTIAAVAALIRTGAFRRPMAEPACDCGWVTDPNRGRKLHTTHCAVRGVMAVAS